jgi:hypothetical protein
MSTTFARAAVVLCASLMLNSCKSITGEDAGPEVSYFGYREARCAASASPLPGFRTCSVEVAIVITKAVSSGTVSVYFNYPGAGSFYHGEISGLAGVTGSRTLTLTNSYVSSCPAIRTTVDIYEGPQSSNSSNLLSTQSNVSMGPLC